MSRCSLVVEIAEMNVGRTQLGDIRKNYRDAGLSASSDGQRELRNRSGECQLSFPMDQESWPSTVGGSLPHLHRQNKPTLAGVAHNHFRPRLPQ
jgi:hypothetical protein